MDRQTERQADGQIDRKTGRWIDRQTERQADEQIDRQKYRQMDRQTDRKTDRWQIDRQKNRQVERHAYGQMVEQTARQTEIDTGMQTKQTQKIQAKLDTETQTEIPDTNLFTKNSKYFIFH